MVSIIVPTYKPGTYIHDCLSSIANQTIDFSNIELLIVLNGPYDPYYDYVKGELDKLPKRLFKRFLYTKDIGVSNARNVGLNYAQGEYILFVDDDDVLSLNYIQEMLKVADGENIVVSNVYSFNLNVKECIMDYLTFRDSSENILSNRSYLSNACCKLIPVKCISGKVFNTNFSQGEDAIFMFDISLNLNKIIKTSPDCIYYSRLRIQSASRQKMKYGEKMRIVCRMQWAFTRIYFSHPFTYSFILYLSRLLAVFKRFHD